MDLIRFVLNGKETEVEVPPLTRVLDCCATPSVSPGPRRDAERESAARVPSCWMAGW
jgi:hypothetical protein